MSFHMYNLYDLLRSQKFFFWTAIARFLVSFKLSNSLFTVEYSTSPKQYVEYGIGLKPSFGKWIAMREKSVLQNTSWALDDDVVWLPRPHPHRPLPVMVIVCCEQRTVLWRSRWERGRQYNQRPNAGDTEVEA